MSEVIDFDMLPAIRKDDYVWHVDCSCALDGLSNLARVSVAPTAQLESECKVRRHHCGADHLGVLPHHRLRLGTEEYHEFQHAADGTERESGIRDRRYI